MAYNTVPVPGRFPPQRHVIPIGGFPGDPSKGDGPWPMPRGGLEYAGSGSASSGPPGTGGGPANRMVQADGSGRGGVDPRIIPIGGFPGDGGGSGGMPLTGRTHGVPQGGNPDPRVIPIGQFPGPTGGSTGGLPGPTDQNKPMDVQRMMMNNPQGLLQYILSVLSSGRGGM